VSVHGPLLPRLYYEPVKSLYYDFNEDADPDPDPAFQSHADQYQASIIMRIHTYLIRIRNPGSGSEDFTVRSV
jgi:hypothetical protein